MYIVLGGLYHLVLTSPFHVVEEQYRVIIFFFLLLCNFFFNLKFSWGRLEKETQIPEDSCTRGLGILTLSPGQKGKQKARDTVCRSSGALR